MSRLLNSELLTTLYIESTSRILDVIFPVIKLMKHKHY